MITQLTIEKPSGRTPGFAPTNFQKNAERVKKVNKPKPRSKEKSLKSLREKLKQLEEKYREVEAKYRALVDHIPAVTYISVFDKSSSTPLMPLKKLLTNLMTCSKICSMEKVR